MDDNERLQPCTACDLLLARDRALAVFGRDRTSHHTGFAVNEAVNAEAYSELVAATGRAPGQVAAVIRTHLDESGVKP
ncbi:MAG: hypothetical protein AAF654_04525 [Myxococcota bacterium]